jgi:hypothetical protein
MTVIFPVIVTVHVTPDGEQPVQLTDVAPVPRAAVRVTTEFRGKIALQVEGQLIVEDGLVTVPAPTMLTDNNAWLHSAVPMPFPVTNADPITWLGGSLIVAYTLPLPQTLIAVKKPGAPI